MRSPGSLIALVFAALFLAAAPAWALTVVVDAGHGGQDRGGGPGQRIPEKPYTLDVALRLAATLRAQGVHVVLTRTGDYFVGLRQRCDIANAQRHAVFVSVHFNGAPRTAADGVETYYYTSQSAALAASVHRRLFAATGIEDRHIRRRGFFVIRRTSIPAILVEPGFLSNPRSGERISGSAAYRQKLAEAIARGIMDRYRWKKAVSLALRRSGAPLPMILTCREMKALEERALAEGITAEALMEEAGRQIAAAVQQFCRDPGKCVVVFGKGHNGGDALVAARHLAAAGWTLEWKPAFPEDAWAPLTRKNWERTRARAAEQGATPAPGAPLIVLDGLLGIGAGGALREPIRSAAREINQLRATSQARVFALDLPTGLDGDSGAADADAVVADDTLTIGFAKRGLLADSATHFVGRLAVLPLEELSRRAPGESAEIVATPENLRPALPRRNFDMHKGRCGRVGLVAGSRGFVGAALMSAEACVRAGAGLITLFVTEDIYPIVATAISPEVMVTPVKSYLEVLEVKTDILALGPGLGKSHASEVRQIVERAKQPMVVDADALNIVASHIHTLDRCAGPRLLTPHPGEMARLDPPSSDRPRRETVEAFTARWPHVLLLKGSRTLIGQRGQALSYNTTGSPGMATGGMGDVLTGVCAALAGQGLALYAAARTGAWLCGRAAELAVAPGAESEESLTPTVLIEHLGRAFDDLRAGCW